MRIWRVTQWRSALFSRTAIQTWLRQRIARKWGLR